MTNSDRSPERTPEEDEVTPSPNDIFLAEQLDMSVEEMYAMFDEINRQIEEEEQQNYEEWPNLGNGHGYTDEGSEESYAG